jgi:hypothetical protein
VWRLLRKEVTRMPYTHTILVPKTLVFQPEYYKCPYCGEEIQKHIHCEAARWHIHIYSSGIGKRCTESNCEDNHGPGRCVTDEKAIKKGKQRLLKQRSDEMIEEYHKKRR